jgi:hypothetical protein
VAAEGDRDPRAQHLVGARRHPVSDR